jgi:hypothetical protein
MRGFPTVLGHPSPKLGRDEYRVGLKHRDKLWREKWCGTVEIPFVVTGE